MFVYVSVGLRVSITSRCSIKMARTKCILKQTALHNKDSFFVDKRLAEIPMMG